MDNEAFMADVASARHDYRRDLQEKWDMAMAAMGGIMRAATSHRRVSTDVLRARNG